MKDFLLSQWDLLCQIHAYTKKYFLLAEEYNIEMRTFLQPMKEQRDAFEHVVRAYGKMLTSPEEKDYIEKNMDKAIGHEYRAFFDALDFLTVSIRKRISDELATYTYKEIIDIEPAYQEIRKNLVCLPEQICELRNRKDIGNKDELLKLVLQYSEIADSLLNFYKEISEKILPKLASK